MYYHIYIFTYAITYCRTSLHIYIYIYLNSYFKNLMTWLFFSRKWNKLVKKTGFVVSCFPSFFLFHRACIRGVSLSFYLKQSATCHVRPVTHLTVDTYSQRDRVGQGNKKKITGYVSGVPFFTSVIMQIEIKLKKK
jgi:hypothetical protein